VSAEASSAWRFHSSSKIYARTRLMTADLGVEVASPAYRCDCSRWPIPICPGPPTWLTSKPANADYTCWFRSICS